MGELRYDEVWSLTSHRQQAAWKKQNIYEFFNSDSLLYLHEEMHAAGKEVLAVAVSGNYIIGYFLLSRVFVLLNM
jgi:hypothetical protein